MLGVFILSYHPNLNMSRISAATSQPAPKLTWYLYYPSVCSLNSGLFPTLCLGPSIQYHQVFLSEVHFSILPSAFPLVRVLIIVILILHWIDPEDSRTRPLKTGHFGIVIILSQRHLKNSKCRESLSLNSLFICQKSDPPKGSHLS